MPLGSIQQLDYSTDVGEAILWHYDSATRLRKLIENKQAWYDQTQRDFWVNWSRDVFNLRTANDFGLSVWAILLDVPLVANAVPSDDRPVFGFGINNLNFYQSNFGRDQGGSISLTTEQKRLVLTLRYFQLVTQACVPEVNEMLQYVFGDQGVCYVLDGLDMTCEYVFTFFPASKILFVLENYDVLPRPAGVKLRILINPGDSFGFDPYYLNFNNSNFAG